jgi:hypothetical protein
MAKYDIDFDYIISYIRDYCDFLDEENYYDNKNKRKWVYDKDLEFKVNIG